MKKTIGLGRGLASLIPSKSAEKVVSSAKDENIYNVEINRIRPNSNQPRRDFDQQALGELAESIKKYGILQPLVVTRVATETNRGRNVEYEIVAGERRWRAAKIAGLPHIPVVVRDDFDENKMRLEVALVENLQREDLNVLEEAEAYAKLVNDFGLSHAAVAAKVGKSREVVSNTLRTLKLPANIKEAIRAGKVERSVARGLLAFKNSDQQQEMFRQLLSGRAGRTDLEETARIIHGSRKDGKPANSKFVELQNNLSSALGTFVVIRSREEKGRIEIKFTSLEELNKIASTILS